MEVSLSDVSIRPNICLRLQIVDKGGGIRHKTPKLGRFRAFQTFHSTVKIFLNEKSDLSVEIDGK